MKKRLLSLLLALCMVPAALPLAALAASSPPAAGTAYATSYSILVDGQAIPFDAYALRDENNNDTNYLKLRDVAHVLNGTAAQFDVAWDGASGSISITTGAAYVHTTGSEMSTPFSGDRPYALSSSSVLVDGRETGLTAITLTDASGGGYTYFKLRDLGTSLGFGVDWDDAAHCIVIDTGGSSAIPNDEYERAVWYGFVSPELSTERSRTVTWREYCTMIGSMLSFKDEALGRQWQELAALALHSEETMVRDQGCFALYRAAELMGEQLNDGGILSVSTNPHLLPSNDGNLPFSWDYTAFTGRGNDAWILDETYEGLFGTMNYINAAMMFCQYRMSLCSFHTLYDTGTDIIGPLTVEDAALSVLRLYESTPDTAQTFWLDRIGKLNDEAAAEGEPEAVTALREQIQNTKSAIVKSDTQIPGQTYTGSAYYVSNHGDDSNDGLTPETAWATLNKVNQAPLSYGDAVFFERGGTYRGVLYLYDPEGYVTLSAYGEGEKPVLTSAEECAAGAEKWTLWQEKDGAKIWKYYKDCLDCGLIVFDDAAAGNKVLADWSGTEWVNEDGTAFEIAAALTEDLDFFSDDGGKFSGATDFCVNDSAAEDVKYGPLYLRCDEGNPGEIYGCIELCTMTTTDMSNGAYEGTVLDGVQGTVYDNLCVKYFPMAGICVGPNEDCVIQNCEIAWGGGCVQFVQDGKVDGRMGDAINGCGTENCTVTGNYIHDVSSSAMIVESYSRARIKDVSVSGNLMERTGNGINIEGNEDVSFENVSFVENVFYLVGAGFGGVQDIRSGAMFSGQWTACFRIRDPYEYTSCTISDNAMYAPLYFFYYCDVPFPELSDNLYVPSNDTHGFADIRYDPQVGPFFPASLDEAEYIIRDVFGDSTSTVSLQN